MSDLGDMIHFEMEETKKSEYQRGCVDGAKIERERILNDLGVFLNQRQDKLNLGLEIHGENTEGWRSTHQRLYELDEVYEWLNKQE